MSPALKSLRTTRTNEPMRGTSSKTWVSSSVSYQFVSIPSSRYLGVVYSLGNLVIARLVQQTRANSGNTTLGRQPSTATTSSATSSLRAGPPPTRSPSSPYTKPAPAPPVAQPAPPPPYTASTSAASAAAAKRAPPPPPPLKPKPKPAVTYVVALYDFAAQVRLQYF